MGLSIKLFTAIKSMLETLSPIQLISAFVILIIAFIVRGITGFGSALIAIPLLALMLPISIVVPLVGALDYISSLTHVLKLRKEIGWKQIVLILPFTLLGILLALYLFNTIDAQLLTKFLGGFIFSYALYTLLPIKPHTHSSYLWAIPGGIFGGLISALFGTGGPFYVIYFQLQGLGKTAFRASIATLLFLDGSVRIIAYSYNGFYTVNTLILIGISLPVITLAMTIGGHIHTSISHQTIQKGMGILLLFSGSALMSVNP